MALNAVLFTLVSVACIAGGANLARIGWQRGIRQERIIAFRRENVGASARIAGIVYVVTGFVLFAGGLLGIVVVARQSW